MNLLGQVTVTGRIQVPKREREILELAALGRTDKEIASVLGISTETVSTYWRRIRQRYGAASRTEVVALAMREQAHEALNFASSENEKLASEIELRRITQLKLTESENRLRTLLANAPLLIATITQQGDLTFTNHPPLLEKMADGLTFFEVAAENCVATSKRIQEAVDEAIVEGKSSILEVTYEVPDAATEWYDIRIAPIKGTRPAEAIIVAIRITEHKFAEKSLTQSESQFQQVADQVRAVLWIADAKTHKLIYLSSAFESVWGIPNASSTSDRWSLQEMIVEEDREKARWQASLSVPDEVTYRIKRPDGSIRTIWDRVFPIHDSEGTVIRLAGIAEDITDLVQLTEQSERQTKFQNLVSAFAQQIAIAKAENTDDVVMDVLQSISRAFECERSVVMKFNPVLQTGSITHEYVQGSQPEIMSAWQDVPLDTIVEVLDAFDLKGAMCIGRTDELPDQSVVASILRAKGMDAALAVPLATSSGIEGLLAIESVKGGRTWSEEEISAMTVIGQMIGSALERRDFVMRIEQSNASRKRLLDLLCESHKIDSTESLYNCIHFKLREVLEYDCLSIYAYDPAPDALISEGWFGPQPVSSHDLGNQTKPGRGIIGHTFELGSPWLVNNAHLSPLSMYPEGVRLESEHLIAAPIITSQAKKGVLLIARHADLTPFDESDFELVQTFVAYLGMAIEILTLRGALAGTVWTSDRVAESPRV